MCQVCFTNSLSSEYLDGLPPIFKSAMQDLYDGKITPQDLHGSLLSHIAKELWSAVSIGFDTDYTKHSPESDHYRLIRDFEENVFVFSGFKTYNQLREGSMLLFDEAGKIKPFNQFLKDVSVINKTYNITYLKAEYDNAVVSGQMATKWESFEPDAMLKFKATIDDHTTEICHSLNGLTKPKSWSGWKRYWLPLHWGERSNIIETTDDATAEHESDLEKPKTMFDGNVALDGIIFPDTHPYFDVCGGKTRVVKNMSCLKTSKSIKRNSKKILNVQRDANFNKKLYNSLNRKEFDYISALNDKGGFYAIEKGADKKDLKINTEIANYFASFGKSVIVRKHVPTSKIDFKKSGASPELLFQGIICDVKTPNPNEWKSLANSIANSVSKAVLKTQKIQSAVINLTTGYDLKNVIQGCENAFKYSQGRLLEMHINFNFKSMVGVTKADFENGTFKEKIEKAYKK